MGEEWFRAAFGTLYRTVYAHRDAPSAKAELEAVLPRLGLPAGARVLDCGCGWGRHLATLRGYGFAAVGIDLSAELLHGARMHRLPVCRADWRALPFGAAFDAVVSLFTSFGYGPTEADDARTVREFARVLTPGGRLLLDVPNPAAVRAGLVPESVRETGGWRITERRQLTDSGRRVEKTVEVAGDGELASWREAVRLYESHDLEAMLRDTGMAVDEVAGGFDGARLEARSQRIVLLGHKR